eukprot:CAMPEP_0173436152 /NCGR_PEP_ID=MMETSP1357-20121228/15792_1 /TAXON_ID=77926 /ORGANISM="Hemiselmis rufescens, Strain PCC563" /LENGTH=328 /DNA_ID=CAMNT_0014401211 /DNA_START=63 /DNA_END=1049 /DNA_ORIENTATION=-
MRTVLACLVAALLGAPAHGFLAPAAVMRPVGRSAPALRSARFQAAAPPSLSATGRRRTGLTMTACATIKPSSNKSVREHLSTMVGDLANKIEQVLGEELELEPFDLPQDLVRVAGEVDGAMCVIENSTWQTKNFRKVHIELATFFNSAGDRSGLDILHCVLFPRHEVVGAQIPMFGCDVVCVRDTVTAAIVDLSPMTREKKLSKDYTKVYDEVCKGLTDFEEPRDIPEFGSHIFGDRCIFVRPSGAEECEQFVELCGEVLRLHCYQTEKLTDGYTPSDDDVQEALEGQNLYCEKQSENEKTRKILEGSFGVDWTERYMTTLLFDKPVV